MKITLLVLISLFSTLSSAQEYEVDIKEIYRSPVLHILNMFSFSASMGYNHTVYNQSLQEFYLMHKNTNSLGLGFKGVSWGIPVHLGLRFNTKKFRIGGGISIEYHRMRPLHPKVGGFGSSYYGQIGYKLYDFWDYSFVAEIAVGNHKNKFNQVLLSQGTFVNLGISIEKNISEYFRITVKPSYDIKSFRMVIVDTNQAINTQSNAFEVNFGISITIPEIPLSPCKSDYIQLKHILLDAEKMRYYEVRGQPIWKVQNPKVGQNDRKFWRYKFENKKKINPY